MPICRALRRLVASLVEQKLLVSLRHLLPKLYAALIANQTETTYLLGDKFRPARSMGLLDPDGHAPEFLIVG